MNNVSQTSVLQNIALDLSSDFINRISKIDWSQIDSNLNINGWAIISGVLNIEECHFIASLYENNEIFRSRVIMSRHGFGLGEYKYFKYPLPNIIGELRSVFYKNLVSIANQWNNLMGIDITFPENHNEFVNRCHAAGQLRPTPLLLQYNKDDYNCLHQDIYGEHVFPLQAVFLLSEPEKNFTGGELVLTEQRPRMQSRPIVVPLKQGDAVIFAVHHRPVKGTRGVYRVNFRHGVSKLYSGKRHTIGVIFHDAK